ncbi:RNase adapter RapZ [Candidatus Avelusimicrobium gallicola]|uniref:RNase adaptor protein RapZ n=1 Tax=Candidatus Avelusimicrobium gallicola TaxID=2562704 RepID=A0A1Y4DER4_9BACT|nr:RNase adapter RapZ [Elusimicrobium sp. An273]OUO57566.1 RNase adaptor protein RapZ [Elusimicrobium sp. An273]
MADNKRRIFIITGLSGAGKSQALKIFGDFGFYCVDNLPLALFKNFTDYIKQSGERKDIALGIDVREGGRLKDMPKILNSMVADDFIVRVIFLDASEECLIRRFSETKHRHPIHKKLAAAIAHEREVMSPIRTMADKVIDTSDLKLGELKEKLSALLGLTRDGDMQISVVSFGFKNGILKDCDIVMDVRFLPNPFYIPELRDKTGLDKEVQNYIMSFKETQEFAEKFADLIKYLIPKYIKEGKSYLTIAMGCTGGKHRSVFMAHELAQRLAKAGLNATEFHRDIGL